MTKIKSTGIINDVNFIFENDINSILEEESWLQFK